MWIDVYDKTTGQYVITIELDQDGLEQIQRDLNIQTKLAEYASTEVCIQEQSWAVGD